MILPVIKLKVLMNVVSKWALHESTTVEDKLSISLELILRNRSLLLYFTVYDIDNTFKSQSLQIERERNFPVRFCSRQLPQSIAVILILLIFYNTNMHVFVGYMYNASNYVHQK